MSGGITLGLGIVRFFLVVSEFLNYRLLIRYSIHRLSLQPTQGQIRLGMLFSFSSLSLAKVFSSGGFDNLGH